MVVQRLKKLVAGVALGSCLFAFSAASCSMLGDESCVDPDVECGNQSLNLGAETQIPLKTVAIS